MAVPTMKNLRDQRQHGNLTGRTTANRSRTPTPCSIVVFHQLTLARNADHKTYRVVCCIIKLLQSSADLRHCLNRNDTLEFQVGRVRFTGRRLPSSCSKLMLLLTQYRHYVLFNRQGAGVVYQEICPLFQKRVLCAWCHYW